MLDPIRLGFRLVPFQIIGHGLIIVSSSLFLFNWFPYESASRVGALFVCITSRQAQIINKGSIHILRVNWRKKHNSTHSLPYELIPVLHSILVIVGDGSHINLKFRRQVGMHNPLIPLIFSKGTLISCFGKPVLRCPVLDCVYFVE